MSNIRSVNQLSQPLQGSRNHHYASHHKNWFIVSPREVILSGMLLTSTFNIENAHQHLSVKFIIKPFINNQEAPFVEIFPQKGNIMRGQIKKVRVKFAKQFKPEINSNGSMKLRIFVSLNTEFNKQYMQAYKLSGWSQIKDLPIQLYEVPILISDDYKQIKENIRQSVIFQSEFGKVSQDLSSLYGEEKFEVPQIALQSRQNLVRAKQKPRYSQFKPYESRHSLGGSQKQKYKQNQKSSSKIKPVYFGNEPKFIESKIQFGDDIRNSKRSRSQSQSSPKNRILQFSTIRNNKQFEPSNNFITTTDIFKNFQDNKKTVQSGNAFKKIQQTKSPKSKNHVLANYENSNISILRSLQQNRNSDDSFQSYKEQQYRDAAYAKSTKNKFVRPQYSQLKTVDNQNFSPHANKRSIQLIILAIIAAFFLALGSNIGQLLN